jgi:nitroreductase/ferredoxin
MSLFTIDEAKCKRDGICVAECPVRIIAMKDADSTPVPTPDAAERCIRCGHCVAVCPHGAFTHALLRTEDFRPIDKALALSPEQTEQFLRSRRSVRTYQGKPVEREKLQKLIELARYAPTGGNSQLVSWLAVNSRAEVKKLTGMVIDLMKELVKAKDAFAVNYRLDRAVADWKTGIDTISRGAPALVIAHAPKAYGLGVVDCTSALAYLDLAAPTVGLGTCWAGFFMLALPQWQPLREALAIPADHVAHGVMMVGYPKYQYHRLVPRNAPQIDWRM